MAYWISTIPWNLWLRGERFSFNCAKALNFNPSGCVYCTDRIHKTAAQTQKNSCRTWWRGILERCRISLKRFFFVVRKNTEIGLLHNKWSHSAYHSVIAWREEALSITWSKCIALLNPLIRRNTSNAENTVLLLSYTKEWLFNKHSIRMQASSTPSA